MTSIACPSCKQPMGIDEADLNITEWECPNCSAVFRVLTERDGSLKYQILSNPVDSTAIHTEPTQSNRLNSRRRRNRASIEAAADEPDLNISLAPVPFQDRFPDLQPGNPPSLFTINGVGTMMYGSRDFDAATGTYVTSACITVFFIPLFIIGSYRVANAPAQGWFSTGGWHVLGSVPLSQLAKGWNWTMLVVTLLTVLSCMFSLR